MCRVVLMLHAFTVSEAYTEQQLLDQQLDASNQAVSMTEFSPRKRVMDDADDEDTRSFPAGNTPPPGMIIMCVVAVCITCIALATSIAALANTVDAGVLLKVWTLAPHHTSWPHVHVVVRRV